MTTPSQHIIPYSLSALVRLSHHRWVIPLVAAIEGGQRFAPLISILGTNRQSLKRALDATEHLGLTRKNPGYGHPLRPEYILTPLGHAIAKESRNVMQAAEQSGWTQVLTKKWSLPILVPIWLGANRYSQIEAIHPQASPRSIAKALIELSDVGCIYREYPAEKPGRPSYIVSPKAQQLAENSVVLARAAAQGLQIRVGSQ